MASKVKDLLVKITGDGAELEKELNRTARNLDAVGRRAERVGKDLTLKFTAPLVAAAAGVITLTHKAAEYADSIDKTSIRTGIARDTLQELSFAAGQLGVSFEGVTGIVEALTRRIPQIEKGTSDTAKAFRQLGVRLHDSRGELRGMDELFPDVIRGLSRIENETQRNAVATQLFGRRAFEIVPLLNAGGEEIQRLMGRARELGLVMGDTAIRDLVAFKDAAAEVGLQFKHLGMDIGQAALPVLQDQLIPFIQTAVIPNLKGMITVVRGLDAETVKMVGSTVAMAAALPPLIWGFGNVARTAATLLTTIGMVKAGTIALGTVLGPGALVMVGLGLLTTMFVRSKVEAAQAAIAIARLRGEVAALNREEAETRLPEATAEYIAAAQALAKAREDLKAGVAAAGGPTRVLDLAEDAAEQREVAGLTRAYQEADATVTRLGMEIGALQGHLDRLDRSEAAVERSTAAMADELEELARKLGAGEKQVRTAADVLEDLATRLRVAAGLSEIKGDEVDVAAVEIAALDAALRELLTMGLEPTDEKVQLLAGRMRELRGAMADAAEKNKELAEDQRLLAQLLAAAVTPAERLAEAERVINQAMDDGVISREKGNAALEAAQKVYDDTAKSAQAFGKALDRVFTTSLNSLIRFTVAGRGNFRDFARALARDLAMLTAQLITFQAILEAVGPLKSGIAGFASRALSVFGGGRADGGPVEPGRRYIVGERGPEIFMPSSPGKIIPNHQLTAGGASGPISLQVNVPPARDPITLARDNQWMKALIEMNEELKYRGYEFEGER